MSAPADLLIENARLWTDGASVPGADAIAITGRAIVAIGPRAELRRRAGSGTLVIDARGGTVTPGLWDAHIHLLPWARARTEIDLLGATSRADMCERVRAHLAAHPGDAPVVGRGWDADGWRERPERAALDALAGARPVLLHSKDFHALWVNGAALVAAGIDARTPDPPGGMIERDASGAPTGVLRETAVRPFRVLEDRAARAAGDEPALLADAARAMHALGITGVHDFERTEAAFGAMERFARGAGPRLRVLQCVGPDELGAALGRGLASGMGDEHFRVGALKLFADGTLGSRTAAMLAPYDDVATSGIEVLPPRELAALVARGLDLGFAVAVHAIGDRACRNTLDAFDRAGAAARSRPALPNRLEHAQLVSPADLPRFAALGVVASVQPLHCPSDANAARRAWGGRINHSYPWRELLDHGAVLAFGSDAPVEPPSIAATLFAACTRLESGAPAAPAFVPEQCVTLDQALRASTEVPARLADLWPRVGSLRAKGLADVVIWNRDLTAAGPERLHEARPSCTVWDGIPVHGPHAVRA